jgi:hypothetical protein
MHMQNPYGMFVARTVAFKPGISACRTGEMRAMRDDSGDLLIVDFSRYGDGLLTSNPA